MTVVKTETATVYRGGGRRWFTRSAAERATARKIIKARCECAKGDYITPPEICSLHRDPARHARIVHLLVVMFIRPDRRHALSQARVMTEHARDGGTG